MNAGLVITDQNREFIQSIIDSFDFYFLIVDETHHILFVNKAVCAAFGLEANKLLGQYCPKAIHNYNGPFPGCPLEISAKSGKAEQVEAYDAIHLRWLDSRIYPCPLLTKDYQKTFLHFTLDITARKLAQDDLAKTLTKLRTALGGIIQAIQNIVERRDAYTAGHQSRVADLARAIAVEMDLTENQKDALRIAGIIHDIGKISVPSEILSKPGKLSAIELNFIKGHPQVGHDILKEIDLPWPIADIILQHHERFDGSGYPSGLKGDGIMLEARIIAVADVVEAMASHRPYRAALGIDKALEEISKNKGILYDAKVAEACLRVFKEKEFRFRLEAENLVKPAE
jgi:putative nucleotidyltransferase with HDIG domain